MSERRPCPGGVGKKRACYAREGSDFCVNHDPALAEKRRLNGFTRHHGPPPVRQPRVVDTVAGQVKEHRATWGPTKAQRKEHERAEWDLEFLRRFEEPLPKAEAGKEEMRRILRAVAFTSPVPAARVKAAEVLHEILQTAGDPNDLRAFRSLDEELAESRAEGATKQ